MYIVKESFPVNGIVINKYHLMRKWKLGCMVEDGITIV
jgi:hypothetical protein